MVVGGIWKVESPDSDLHYMRRCEKSLIHMTHCSTDENNLGRSDAAAGGSSGADLSIGVFRFAWTPGSFSRIECAVNRIWLMQAELNASDWEWGSSRRKHRTSLTGGRVFCGGGREIGQRSVLEKTFLCGRQSQPVSVVGWCP